MRGALGVSAVLIEDLFELLPGVAEVGLGVKALGDDGDVVVEAGCLDLSLDCANINLLLIYHDHHLPLHLVFRHPSEHRASEISLAELFVAALRLSLNDYLGKGSSTLL